MMRGEHDRGNRIVRLAGHDYGFLFCILSNQGLGNCLTYVLLMAIVARVLLQRGVEHVVCHLPTHPVFVRITQIFRGLIRVYEDIIGMVETSVFTASGADK